MLVFKKMYVVLQISVLSYSDKRLECKEHK